MKAQEILKNNLNNSITAKKKLLADEDNLNEFNLALNCLLECYKNGGKLYLAGNGGSAADSQHLAAELISKLAYDRNPLPAEAITTDTSAITAIANDYGYEYIFSRQLEGNASDKDMFLAITTSGKSDNLIKALKFCKERGIKTILFTGKDGGQAIKFADFSIIAPGESTASIQELHILLGHSMCEFIEKSIFPVK
tara:strand:- start:923 stop:1510 length:588 start_codon:yes stop_codon:yes gene_type:complete